MKTGTLLIWGVVAVAGYFIYQDLKNTAAASNSSASAGNGALGNLGSLLDGYENDLIGATGGNGVSGLTDPTGAGNNDIWNNAGANELTGDNTINGQLPGTGSDSDNSSSSDPYDG